MTDTRSDFEIPEPAIRTWSTFVPEETIKAVEQVLRSRWINTGACEKALREEIRRKFGAPYCVACSNGTAALRVSYAAIGIKPGDEVVTTPYTFIATNTSILEQGAAPVFADIHYDSLNLDPESVRSKITAKTKAIVCVHYGGYACELDALREVAREHGLPLVEDSAHALGSKYRGRYIGSDGDYVTFSLQAVKIVTAGDGGIVCTSHPDAYDRLKKLVWYGVDREAKKTTILDPLPEEINQLGFKYNMNDIIASIGLAGLQQIDRPLARRREIGLRYRDELRSLRAITLLRFEDNRSPNFQIFPIHVQERARFARFMRERGVMTLVNNRRNDRYKVFGAGVRDLPNTARADQDTILIPIHADLSDSDVSTVIHAIHEYDRLVGGTDTGRR